MRTPIRIAVLLVVSPLLACVCYAQNITVTKARIGCLDIQKDGNLTKIVAQACNGRKTCSYKAPTEDQYKRKGVQAKKRSFCTQGMEIVYGCGPNDSHTVMVPGEHWSRNPRPRGVRRV